MRLDLFLKASRLCPRRSVAQKLCDAGLVLLNGNKAKSAHPVKVADEIVLQRRDRVVRLRVLALPVSAQTSKDQARALFEKLGEEPMADDAELLGR